VFLAIAMAWFTSSCVFAVPDIQTTPSLSVSTLMFAALLKCSAASFDLILVVMIESLTKVAGLARSVSESMAWAATGASAAPRTKQVVASEYLMIHSSKKIRGLGAGLKASQQEQDDHDHQHDTDDPAWAVAPVAGIGPCGNDADKH